MLILLSLSLQFAPGKVVDGRSASGMDWHVRLPARHDPRKAAPALVFFHGSNMSTMPYLQGFTEAWPKLVEDYVLIGIDGENPVKDSPGAFNYSYVNFVGRSKYKGFPGTERESPARVAEAVEELKTRLKLSKIFVGGHSQGGFLAYSCYMNYPELFAGAFPVSGGLIVQCEPTAYESAELRTSQRKGAIAIVHGENDPIVEFSMAAAALESFQDDAFPRVRLFTDQRAAHRFVFLPVEAAVRWLEEMTSDVPLEPAARKVQAGEWRDASALLLRAAELGAKPEKLKPLRKKLEDAAAAAGKGLEKRMAEKGGGWVADFLRFRAQFEFTDAAKPLLESYGKLRTSHEKPAEELFNAARGDFQAGRKDAGYAKCEEIVTSYYASSWYRYAQGTLARRGP